MPLIVIVAVPLFVKVAAFGAPPFPTATDTQLMLVGETVAARQLTPESAHKARPVDPAKAAIDLGFSMLIQVRVDLAKMRDLKS
jgi:hypothetical protein